MKDQAMTDNTEYSMDYTRAQWADLGDRELEKNIDQLEARLDKILRDRDASESDLQIVGKIARARNWAEDEVQYRTRQWLDSCADSY